LLQSLEEQEATVQGSAQGPRLGEEAG
jgi:hypothetical protein